uniref:Uncharacterized protein n=1 Tax=Ciona intestinalis TaxID=7719 RepID=H2XZW9_CIOIN
MNKELHYRVHVTSGLHEQQQHQETIQFFSHQP